jgi:hypothetical protein
MLTAPPLAPLYAVPDAISTEPELDPAELPVATVAVPLPSTEASPLLTTTLPDALPVPDTTVTVPPTPELAPPPRATAPACVSSTDPNAEPDARATPPLACSADAPEAMEMAPDASPDAVPVDTTTSPLEPANDAASAVAI